MQITLAPSQLNQQMGLCGSIQRQVKMAQLKFQKMGLTVVFQLVYGLQDGLK
jgi:hypothetical protein